MGGGHGGDARAPVAFPGIDRPWMPWVLEYVDRLADQLLDPRKRVFVGYLASALVLALGFRMLAAGATLFRSLALVFSARVWWSRSARADYAIAAVNQAIMMGVAPRLISRLTVATLLFEAMHVWFGGRSLVWLEAPGLGDRRAVHRRAFPPRRRRPGTCSIGASMRGPSCGASTGSITPRRR